MKRLLFLALFCFLTLPLGLLHAQKNEIALSLGAAVSPDGKGFLSCGEAILCNIPPGTIGPLGIGTDVAWQATFAHRVANFRVASLYVEFPVVGSPSRTAPSGSLFSNQFSSLFFTPSTQVKLLPGSRISPFASIGGGLAHFGAGVSSSNTGALQVGGGIDFKTPLPLLSVRTEIRDFITGRPETIPFGSFASNHIQTVFAGGGVVIRF